MALRQRRNRALPDRANDMNLKAAAGRVKASDCPQRCHGSRM